MKGSRAYYWGQAYPERAKGDSGGGHLGLRGARSPLNSAPRRPDGGRPPWKAPQKKKLPLLGFKGEFRPPGTKKQKRGTFPGRFLLSGKTGKLVYISGPHGEIKITLFLPAGTKKKPPPGVYVPNGIKKPKAPGKPLWGGGGLYPPSGGKKKSPRIFSFFLKWDNTGTGSKGWCGTMFGFKKRGDKNNPQKRGFFLPISHPEKKMGGGKSKTPHTFWGGGGGVLPRAQIK